MKSELTAAEYNSLPAEDKKSYARYSGADMVKYLLLPTMPHVTFPSEKTLTADNFFELASFSSVPIVNEYYKSVKAMHHDFNITRGIEEFAKWQKSKETGLDLNKLEGEVDNFIANTTGEDYEKFFETTDPLQETVEQAAEKYYWSDEAAAIALHPNRVNKAFEAGANWQKLQGISKKAVIDLFTSERESCPELTGICNHLISKIKALDL